MDMYKRMKELIYSKELVESIQLLAQDPEGDSAIHLPEEEEFQEIIKNSINMNEEFSQ